MVLPILIVSVTIVAMRTAIKYLKFGRYLVEKKLISNLDVLQARYIQRKNNLRVGELARSRGWINEDNIERVLVIQEETYEKFGEIAIREEYLTREQIEDLLKEQEDNYLFFGEAIVRIGALSEEKVLEELREFNKLKFQGDDAKRTAAVPTEN